MTLNQHTNTLIRLKFLRRVVHKECQHLISTDKRGRVLIYEMFGLRNQMVHEYVEDLTVLTSALQTGHAFVPALIAVANRLMAEIDSRGWA